MITYLKGPLGWAVLKDGKPKGSIKKRGKWFLVSIEGFRPGVDPSTKGTHAFQSLEDAKQKAEDILRG